MFLKYLGTSGPNGERKNEVREYTEEQAKSYLHLWPSHFVKASEDEISKIKNEEPLKGKKNKPANVRDKK